MINKCRIFGHKWRKEKICLEGGAYVDTRKCTRCHKLKCEKLVIPPGASFSLPLSIPQEEFKKDGKMKFHVDFRDEKLLEKLIKNQSMCLGAESNAYENN